MRVQCVQLRGAMARKTNDGKREQARTMYLAGVKQSLIAERLCVPIQTLKSWISRGGWPQDKQSASSAIAVARQETAAELTKRKAVEIELFLDEQIQDAKLLRGKALEQVLMAERVSVDELKTAGQVLGMASEMARKAYGLDSKNTDNSPKTLVNISMAPGSNLTSPIGKPIEAQPIDVAPLDTDSDA